MTSWLSSALISSHSFAQSRSAKPALLPSFFFLFINTMTKDKAHHSLSLSCTASLKSVDTVIQSWLKTLKSKNKMNVSTWLMMRHSSCKNWSGLCDIHELWPWHPFCFEKRKTSCGVFVWATIKEKRCFSLSLVLNKQALLMVLFSFFLFTPSSCRISSGIPSQACVWICARGDLEESW